MSNLKVKIVNTDIDGDKIYKLDGDTLYIARDLYKRLSSVINNSRLDPNEDSVFMRFMHDMNKFNEGIVVDEGLEILNKYLGILGTEIEYPLDRQRLDINGIKYSGYKSPFEQE